MSQTLSYFRPSLVPKTLTTDTNCNLCGDLLWLHDNSQLRQKRILNPCLDVPRPMTRTGDILVYARVSTVEQDLSAQIIRLKDAGAIHVFEDVVAGKQFDRLGLSALIDHARPSDSLAIVSLDRLGRSLKELLETVENLKTQNIGLISLEERIDTTSAAGELIFHVFGAIAHFERRLISERTKDDIEAARAQGRKPGRPPPEAETILALQNLVQAGMTAGQAAKQLGIARLTAYRLIKETAQP